MAGSFTGFCIGLLAREYAKGLSAWQHRVCKKFAAKQLEQHDPAGWLEAKAEIARLIDDEFMHKKQRSRTKIARYKENAQPAPAQADLALPAPKVATKKPRPSLVAQEAPPAPLEPQPLAPTDVLLPEPARPAKRFKPVQRQRTSQALEAEQAELLEDQA